uniref:response regulator transcription factor n=1 Tax=Nostocoides japonicum TaxID=99481 RepID=UPI0019109303|nr:response regulator transcription factor [Tetrasphaera japonica]
MRVVLAEDSALLREGLRGLVDAQDDLEVARACDDLPSLLRAIDELRPDVVLTDIRMPPAHGDEGVQAAEHARRASPHTGVVLLSQYVDLACVRTLLRDGADGRGYLLKERVADVADLVAAIRRVAEGGSVIDPKVVEALVRSRGNTPGSHLDRLTAREREVLGEMARGRTNGAIAESLVITQRAVEKHVNSIFAKLGVGHDDGVHPRVRAVLLYLSEAPAEPPT